MSQNPSVPSIAVVAVVAVVQRFRGIEWCGRRVLVHADLS